MSPFSPFGAGRVATVLPRHIGHHRHRPHHHRQHWQHWSDGGVVAFLWGVANTVLVLTLVFEVVVVFLLTVVVLFLSMAIAVRWCAGWKMHPTSDCSASYLWFSPGLPALSRRCETGFGFRGNRFFIKDIETIEATSKPASEWVGFGKDYGSWTLECHLKGDLTPTVFMSEEHSFSDFRLHICLSAR